MAEASLKKTILFVSTIALSKTIQTESFGAYRLVEARSSTQALAILEKETVHIVFFDIEKEPSQEFDLVHYVKTRSPHTEIVILTTIADLDFATKALRNGASFYLIKPVTPQDLKDATNKLLAKVDNLQDYRELEQRVLTDLMAGSPPMQKLLKLAMKIAPTTSTVLLHGESGTGKEFFAQIIHHMSHRTGGKLVALNCGSIPETLFESELFGHVKGSFTGADRDRVGLVEEAHLGTLFLDEIGELSPAAQVKLLRFLQERSFKRIGENIQRSVNVRIVAATNKDLKVLIAENKFREDLYYRLNVFSLVLPPLRNRKETIPNLIKLFMHKNNELLDKNIVSFSPQAEAILAHYDYPGNIRELQNILEHAMVLCDTNEITEKDLPEFMLKNHLMLPQPQNTVPCQKISTDATNILSLSDMEKRYINHVLILVQNNYSDAAKKLGISRSTLWRKIKEYNLDATSLTNDSLSPNILNGM